MMYKYVSMYLAWILGVLAMAFVAVTWYGYVEEIGAREIASRLRATEATEATEADDG